MRISCSQQLLMLKYETRLESQLANHYTVLICVHNYIAL